MSATIQSLPVELLQQIFDHLTASDRIRMASLVCHQWHQIAWSDRYVRRMMATVTNENLSSKRVLRWMRRRPFRKLNIEDRCQNAPERDLFAARVRKLLSSRKIRLNLQELRLLARHRFLNAVLNGHNPPVNFPRLTEIIYSPGSRKDHHEDIPPTFEVRASSLTVLKIDAFTNAAIDLVRAASRRLRSLSLRFVERDQLLQVLAIESFEALQHAGLFAVPSGRNVDGLRSGDLLPVHRATLAKLDRLEIRDSVNMFGHVYGDVFLSAVNLTQLHVTGLDMAPTALAYVHGMKKLCQLHLYIFSLAPGALAV